MFCYSKNWIGGVEVKKKYIVYCTLYFYHQHWNRYIGQDIDQIEIETSDFAAALNKYYTLIEEYQNQLVDISLNIIHYDDLIEIKNFSTLNKTITIMGL